MTHHDGPASSPRSEDPIEPADVEDVVPGVDDVLETFDHDGVYSPTREAEAPPPG